MGTSSVLWSDFSSNWKHVFTACFSSILEGCYLIPVSSPHITLTPEFLPAWHLHPILVCGLLQTWAFQGQVLQTGDISSLGEITTWKLPTAGRSVTGTQWITMPWMLALSTWLDPPSGNGGEKNKIKKKALFWTQPLGQWPKRWKSEESTYFLSVCSYQSGLIWKLQCVFLSRLQAGTGRSYQSLYFLAQPIKDSDSLTHSGRVWLWIIQLLEHLCLKQMAQMSLFLGPALWD